MMDAPATDASRSIPEAPQAPEDAPVVAFIGDSICAGLHLAEHQAFPAVLEARMAEDRPFRLVSSCESGRTTAGGVTAFDWVLRSEPDLVVLEIGGNDGLRGIPIESIEANLRKMIDRSRAEGIAVMLLGVRLPSNYGEYAEAFDALYPKLAEEYDLPFVPFFMEGVGGVPELNTPDGLHPTAEGQEKLATNVEATLRAVLENLSAGS